MRGMLGLLSLLIAGVGAAYYFTSLQAPVQEKGQYQKIESQAQHAATLMQNDGQAAQAQVDAASGDTPPAPATNAPPGGN
jgi:hypothetical protein